MGFWTAIVIIVAIGTLSEVYRSRIKADANRSAEEFDKLAARMAQLETRMANLETIVLDKEKSDRFAALRDEPSTS
jgi:hypothetical protein